MRITRSAIFLAFLTPALAVNTQRALMSQRDGADKGLSPRSLLQEQVQHSVQAYDSKERLRKLNKDLADAEAMFQQQLMQAGTTAQQNVDAEVPSIQSSVTDTSKRIEKLSIDVTMYKDQVKRTVDGQLTTISQFMTEMATSNGEITSGGEAMLRDFEDMYQEFRDLVKEMSGETSSEFREMADDNVENIDEHTSEMVGLFQEAVSDLTDVYSDLNAELADATEESKEVFEEVKENEDEIEDVVKEVRSEMKDIYKENDRIVKNVQRTAVKMIPKIDSMADKANNVAKRSLINLAREEMRATKEALVSGKADAKEVLGEQREEIKSMSSDMRDVEKDLQAERSGIKAGSMEEFIEHIKVYQEAVYAIEEANDEGETLEEEAADEEQSSRDALVDAQADYQEMLAELNSDLNEEEDEEKDVLRVELANTQETVQGKLHGYQAAVEQVADQELAKLETKISKEIAEASKLVQQTRSYADEEKSRVDLDTVHLMDLKNILTDISSEIGQKKQDVDAQVAASEQKAGAELKRVETDVTGRQSTAEQTLTTDAGKVEQAIMALINGAESDLLEKISTKQQDSIRLMDGSEQKIEDTIGRTQDVLSYMRTASDNVQQLSDRIRSVFPTLRQESSEKLDLMDSEVTGAQTKLNEMKTQTESEVAQKTEELTQKITAALDQEREQMKNKLDASSNTITQKITDIAGDQSDFASTLAQDTESEKEYMGNTRSALRAIIEKVSGASDAIRQGDSQITLALDTEKSKLAGLIEDQETMGKRLERGLKTRFALVHHQGQADIRNAELANVNQLKSVANSGLNELRRVLDAALAPLKAKHYEYKREAKKIRAIEAVLNHVEQESRSSEESADKDLQMMENMEKDSNKGFQNTQRQIDGALGGMGQAIGTYGDEMDRKFSADTMKQLFDYRVQMGANSLKEKKTVFQMIKSNKAKLDDDEQHHESMLAGIFGSMKMLEKDRKDMKSFTAEQLSELGDLAGQLQGMSKEEQALLVNSLSDIQQKTKGGESATIDAIQQALIAGKSSGSKQTAMMSALKKQFEDRLEAYQIQSQDEASGITGEISRLVNNAPNFANMFKEDTMDAESKLDAAGQKINAAAVWSTNVWDRYKARLDEMQSTRSTTSEDLHKKVSDFKKTLVPEVTTMVESVEGIYRDLAAAQTRQEEAMTSMNTILSAQANIDASHNASQIDSLNAAMFTAEERHKTLLRQVKHFFHYDAAFNAEVNSKLGRDQAEVESGASAAASEDMQQMLNYEEQLSQSVRRLKRKSRRVSEQDSKGYSKLAGLLGHGIEEVMANRHKEDDEIAREEKLAMKGESQLHEISDSTIHRIASLNEGVGYQAALLKKEEDEAQAMAGSMFGLAKETASTDNLNTDQQIDDLHYRTRSLIASGTPGSLLQASSNETVNLTEDCAEEESASSLRKGLAKDSSSEEEEEKALVAVNAELERENRKIETQNERLEERLNKTWAMLEAHNLTRPGTSSAAAA